MRCAIAIVTSDDAVAARAAFLDKESHRWGPVVAAGGLPVSACRHDASVVQHDWRCSFSVHWWSGSSEANVIFAFYLLCGVFRLADVYLLPELAGLGMDRTQLGLPEIPGLLFNATGVPLIGASAGVFGVIIGGALSAAKR